MTRAGSLLAIALTVATCRPFRAPESSEASGDESAQSRRAHSPKDAVPSDAVPSDAVPSDKGQKVGGEAKDFTPDRLVPAPAWAAEKRRTLLRALPTHVATDQLKELRVASDMGSGTFENLWAILDEQAPRPLREDSTLGGLVDEDSELSPGWHVLLVFAEHQAERKIVFTSHRFSLDVTDPGRPPTVYCALIRPRGTYNGEAAQRIDFVPLSVSDQVTRLRLVLTGPEHVSRLLLGASEAAQQVKVVSGDHHVRLDCLDETQESLQVVRRIFTVNRDLEESR